jgi:tight adherence protein B
VFSAVFVGALALAHLVGGAAGSDSRRLRRRLDRAKRAAGAERAGAVAGGPVATVRRQEARSVLGGAARGLAFLVPRASVLRGRLDRAGLTLSVVDFAVSCVALGLAAGVVAVFAVGLTPWLAAAVGLAAGVGVPHTLVNSRARGQRRRFTATFPDAIDLIVRSVRSGLPVAEAVQSAAQECHGVVAAVFGEVTGGLRLGLTLDQALSAASRRIEVQEFKFFVISLAIQQETGGNLAEILQNLSQMMRRREQVKMKIKAMSSEARASAMIIGSLPFIMFVLIYMVNQPYIMKFFIDPRGWLLLAVGLGSLFVGVGVMAKMVRFEV